MATVDLAARRKARNEARTKKEAPTFTFADEDGGNEREFVLPRELPGEALFGIGAVSEGHIGGLRDVIYSLLGEDQYAEFMRLRPSDKDLMELVNSFDEFYGEEPGKSQPSAGSSTSTGKRSKQTSSTNTK